MRSFQDIRLKYSTWYIFTLFFILSDPPLHHFFKLPENELFNAMVLFITSVKRSKWCFGRIFLLKNSAIRNSLCLVPQASDVLFTSFYPWKFNIKILICSRMNKRKRVWKHQIVKISFSSGTPPKWKRKRCLIIKNQYKKWNPLKMNCVQKKRTFC